MTIDCVKILVMCQNFCASYNKITSCLKLTLVQGLEMKCFCSLFCSFVLGCLIIIYSFALNALFSCHLVYL